MTIRTDRSTKRMKWVLAAVMVFWLLVPGAVVAAETTVRAIADSQGKVTVGSNFTSNGPVWGDVVTIFGSSAINDAAKGDVVSVLGSTTVRGQVNGDVVAVLGNADIGGQVGGDVVAVGGTAYLRNGAVVTGDVVASSIERSPEAVIHGEIVQIPVPRMVVSNGNGWAPVAGVMAALGHLHNWFKVVNLIITLIVVMIIVGLFPGGVENIARSAEADTWRDLGIGFIATLLFIPICLTLIGIPAVILVALAAKFLGYAGVWLLIGRKFAEGVRWNPQSPYLPVLAGAILVALVEMVPFVGGFIGLFLFWISLGAMLDSRFGTGRPWFGVRSK